MGGGRERLADLLHDAVSFGAPRGAAQGAQRKRAPRKAEEEAAIMRRTSAGGRVAHAINELAKKIRHSSETQSLSNIMRGWVTDLRLLHASKTPASGTGGGTVMENAMVAKYNGGYETLGFTKAVPYYGGDGRAWLVYHALGGPDIDAVGNEHERKRQQLHEIQSATRGHHVTGKYKQNASQRHQKLLDQLVRIVGEALELEAIDPNLDKAAKLVKVQARKYAAKLAAMQDGTSPSASGGDERGVAEEEASSADTAQQPRATAPAKATGARTPSASRASNAEGSESRRGRSKRGEGKVAPKAPQTQQKSAARKSGAKRRSGKRSKAAKKKPRP
jgi:hypothetical protein